jgi:hypothetical protein
MHNIIALARRHHLNQQPQEMRRRGVLRGNEGDEPLELRRAIDACPETRTMVRAFSSVVPAPASANQHQLFGSEKEVVAAIQIKRRLHTLWLVASFKFHDCSVVIDASKKRFDMPGQPTTSYEAMASEDMWAQSLVDATAMQVTKLADQGHIDTLEKLSQLHITTNASDAIVTAIAQTNAFHSHNNDNESMVGFSSTYADAVTMVIVNLTRLHMLKKTPPAKVDRKIEKAWNEYVISKSGSGAGADAEAEEAAENDDDIPELVGDGPVTRCTTCPAAAAAAAKQDDSAVAEAEKITEE